MSLPFDSWTLVLVTLVLVVLLTFGPRIVEGFKRRKWLEEVLSGFPTEPRHWLFGHLHLFDETQRSLDLSAEWGSKHVPGFVVWIGPFNASYVCSHPTTVKALLSTAEPKDDFGYGMLKSWLGDGLLISNGSKWARDRKLLTPGFHFDVLKPYAKIFNDCSKVLLSKWHEQSQEGSVDVFHHVSLLTLDCLMNCVFSQDGDCQRQENNPYIRSVYSASQLFAKRFFNMFHYNDVIYYLSSNGRQWRKTLDILHSYSHSVITQRRRALQQEQRSGIKHTRKYIDFLDILLSAKDEDGNGMTDREIQDQVDTFMFEGHDTTASGISWCLYNLAKHAHHQRKCQTEIDDCFAKKTNADLSWDDLNNFPYLTMCIKESLRITPPVLNHSRELTIPLHFPDGTSLPAGMWTSINVYATHHNNSVWENPEVYDPSRFLPEKVKLRSPHAFIPFSAGPRNCIGQNFAMNEMKITLANILHNFELSADESKPVVPIAEIIYKTRNGMFLNLKKRVI